MEVLYACEPIYGINHVIYIIYTYARWRIHIYVYSCVDASMNQSTYLCDLCVNISILLSVKFIPVHPGVIYLITYSALYPQRVFKYSKDYYLTGHVTMET